MRSAQTILRILLLTSLLSTILGAPLPAGALGAPVGGKRLARSYAIKAGEPVQATASGTPYDERAASKMDEEVLAHLRDDPSEPLTVIVHLGGEADLSGAAAYNSRVEQGAYVYQTLLDFAAQKQAGLRSYLASSYLEGSIIHYRPYFIFNGVAVTASAEVIWEIAARDDVEAITPNHIYQLDQAVQDMDGFPPAAYTWVSTSGSNPDTVEWNIAQINADQVWDQYGVIGEGVLVANLDSGVEYTHPALVEQYAGNQGGSFDHDFHWYDAVNGGLAPYDDNNHGTHTMGSIVGGDGPGPFVDDIGVAPGARWVAVKAFSAAGTGETADIHAAFEWLLAPCPAGVQPGDPACDPVRAPAVVNNSWGSRLGARTEFLPDVIALRAAGIWPAFSAGNNGPAPGTIGSPGSFAESFATGATDSSDVIADFSSRGPSPLTEEIKPDVVAPGVDVRSSIPGGSYYTYNGTSMACPHSTGLAALLLSAAPDLDLDMLEEIIRSTTLELGDPGPDMTYGYGRIDALGAIQRILSSGTLSGTVQDAGTFLPIAGVNIRAQGQGLDLTATSGMDGSYTLSYLINGAYTLTAAYYGYEPVVITDVLVITGQVTTQDINLVSLPRYTLSGHVYDAISTTVPVTNAVIRVLDTPLPPAPVDATGFYSLTVAAGAALVEAAAFGYATGITATSITTDTVLDFYLEPLPPILLVDDDEGNLRNYSPHVQEYYFMALDSNGYNYTYWDIEKLGAPDFATMRQYAAVVWFGGEFGRIKDISDAAQAQVVMDYLDLGGRFFYIAQDHTFYYGDDGECDTPTWGGTGPCPFTEHYLGVADWVEDQGADVTYGVTSNPVGDGFGPIVMAYPPFLTDYSDNIFGTLQASLAFTATDATPAPGQVNMTAYTVVSPTVGFKTVFFATPLEAMPPAEAADVMYAVMEWFGVAGLTEGLTLSPHFQEGLALAGETISFTLRIRNLNLFSDTFDLAVIESSWPTEIWDAGFNAPITQIGPIAPLETADFGVSVMVPVGTAHGAQTTSLMRATSQSGVPYFADAELLAKSRMVYYMLDSDQCDSGVHFEWVDATGGDRWDLDEYEPLPEYVSVTLPLPFVFYNQTYDHLWINDHGTVLFGDDNIYDDAYPSGNPPIPNPTMLDPNGAIYIAWGTSFWHPADQDPDAAVYTFHDTSGGRNWFVVEYYLYENLLGGGPDTFEVILDLDTYEITMQYQEVTYSNFAVVGIENQTGTEGILYVNDQQPPQNILHDGLAIRYGLGEPPEVIEIFMEPAAIHGTGVPGGVMSYTLTLYSTSNITDGYTLETADHNWPTSLWDPTFATPISELGPLTPCSSAQFGVQVELPPNPEYVKDSATIRARSQINSLVTASSMLTTDNADPAVSAGPDAWGGAFSGYVVEHVVWVTNTGNVTDTYSLALTGYSWPTAFTPPLTQTGMIPPSQSQAITVHVDIPASVYAGSVDTATLQVSSQYYPGTEASATITTEALANVAVVWDQAYQEKTGPQNWNVSYYVTVRNIGNVDDAYLLDGLAADWGTTIWNESFTQQITQTGTLGPDETQRVGVRVHIPAGVSPPDQDASLIRATSNLDPQVFALSMLVTAVNPAPPGDYGVQVSPSGDWQLASPGETVTYTLWVTNTGTTSDSFTLSVSGNDWPVQHPSGIPALDPGAGTGIEIVVSVPLTASTGIWDQVVVLITSDGDTTVAGRADLITLAPDIALISPAVAVGPDQSGEALPGETITYTLYVTNTGNVSDSYTLEFSGNVWTASLSLTQTETLVPGAIQAVTLQVSVPITAMPGGSDSVDLLVTSQGYPGVVASAVITTGVPDSTPGIPGVAVGPDQAGYALPGTVITYTLFVTNTGDVSDTYASGFSGNAWVTVLSPTQTGQLVPGERGAVLVRVTLPLSVTEGVTDTVFVTVTSVNFPGVSATATIRTEALPLPPVEETFDIYLPMLARSD